MKLAQRQAQARAHRILTSDFSLPVRRFVKFRRFGQEAPRYRRRFLAAAGLAGLPDQKSTICRIASAWVTATCFLAALVTCPRALPAALFAADSHMLMKGFFLTQGLLIPIRSGLCPNRQHEVARGSAA
jgi:hypothetical protein